MTDRRFRFSVLGGVELRRPDGSQVRSILAQPMRVALLAYVAIEAPGGFVTRERIMSVLWPDSDTTRARQSLRNALYKIRQDSGQEILVNRGATNVGADPELLSVDAVDVREALSSGRLSDAVDLYSGPLLPGFHVDDCPDFEEWTSGVRTALHRDVLRAVGDVANSREATGDVDGARTLLRRAQVMAPADEEILRQRLQLLARQGNRATALAEGQEWIERLQASLGVEPSEATLILMRELRSSRSEDAVPSPPKAVGSQRQEVAIPEEEGPAPTLAETARRPTDPRAAPGPDMALGPGRATTLSRSTWRTMAGWVVGPAAVIIAAWAIDSGPPSIPPADRGVIVERFDVEGEAMDVAAGFALGALTARLLDAGEGGVVLPPEGVSAASQDGIERRLIKGRLRQDGESLIGEIELATTAQPDEILVRATAAVDRFDLESLAYRLVAELASQSGEALGAKDAVPPLAMAPLAVLPFFEGEVLAEAGRTAEAREAYRRAVALDSTLAMAYFRLSMVESELGLRADAREASDRAVRLSQRLTGAERARLDAWRLYEGGFIERALPLYEALAEARGLSGSLVAGIRDRAAAQRAN